MSKLQRRIHNPKPKKPFFKTDTGKILLWIFCLAAFIFVLSLGACSPAKQLEKLERKHPELFQAKTKDSVSVKIRYVKHDTSILVPGKEIKIHDTIPCPGVDYSRTVKNDGISVSATLDKDILTVDCKTDSLMHEIEIRNKVIDSLRVHSTVITLPPVTTNVIPFMYKFCFWLLILIAAGFAIWKLGPAALSLIKKIPF